MGFGTVVYTTTLPALKTSATLHTDVHDYAVVFMDGKRVGAINRAQSQNSVVIPACAEGTDLKMVVEGMGRINFGYGIYDYKGIVGQPCIELTNAGLRTNFEPLKWKVQRIPV